MNNLSLLLIAFLSARAGIFFNELDFVLLYQLHGIQYFCVIFLMAVLHCLVFTCL